ncbi:MAG TPA: 50S ribosomal protein L22, partial [Actinomycetota bacterium]|nr:50S ribosomal protein L22 [Actinomycetota bacterium]
MARKIAPDAQEAIATARYIRISPTKARQVVDLIRGRHVDDARRVLRFNERGASTTVGKVLASAVANAQHNDELDPEELFVKACFADEGPTLKRFTPRARGRAGR